MGKLWAHNMLFSVSCYVLRIRMDLLMISWMCFQLGGYPDVWGGSEDDVLALNPTSMSGKTAVLVNPSTAHTHSLILSMMYRLQLELVRVYWSYNMKHLKIKLDIAWNSKLNALCSAMLHPLRNGISCYVIALPKNATHQN